MVALPGLQMTVAALVAEPGQTLSSLFTVEPEPSPNRVVVKKKGRSDIRATHSLVQQCKRVGASSQTMLDQAVPSQLDQLCPFRRAQKSRANHADNRNPFERILQDIFAFSMSRGIRRKYAQFLL